MLLLAILNSPFSKHVQSNEALKPDHCLNACEIRVFRLIFWYWPGEVFIGAKFDRFEELYMRNFVLVSFSSNCSKLSVLKTIKLSEVSLPTIPSFRGVCHARYNDSFVGFYFCFQLYVSFFPDSLIKLREGSCWLFDSVIKFRFGVCINRKFSQTYLNWFTVLRTVPTAMIEGSGLAASGKALKL